MKLNPELHGNRLCDLIFAGIITSSTVLAAGLSGLSAEHLELCAGAVPHRTQSSLELLCTCCSVLLRGWGLRLTSGAVALTASLSFLSFC